MPFKYIKRTTIPVETVLDVGVGATHGYLLDQSSYLWAWGQNSGTGGPLPCGTGNLFNYSTPVQAIASKKFAKLLNGDMVLDESNYVWIWGDYATGQLGQNAPSAGLAMPASVVGGIRWLDIKGQYSFRVGLNLSSYAWAWGDNAFGQLGDNTIQTRSSPVSVIGGKQFISIAVGHCNTGKGNWVVGLDASSYAWTWGSGYELGDNTAINKSSPVSVVGGKQWRMVVTTQTKGMVSGTCIALDSSSYAWAWGYNSYGQMGISGGTIYSSPISVHGPWDTIHHLGGFGFLGVRGTDYYVWGANANYGGLGNNTTIALSAPTLVTYPFKIKKIAGAVAESTGAPFAIAMDTNNKLWSWGYNGYGQLGQNNTFNCSYPTMLVDKVKKYSLYTYSHPTITTNGFCISGFTDYSYQMFLDASSYAWAWGANNYGNLGINSTASPLSPVSVVGDRQFKNVYLSGGSSFAIDISGYGWAWGGASYGCLGDNIGGSRSSPVSIAGGKKWLKIIPVSVDHRTYGIDTSSYVWAWGENGSGTLGDGTTTNRSSPVSVLGGRQVRDIVALTNSALILDMSSYVWTWGNGSKGYIGNNTTNSYSSPVSVVGNRQFIAIGGCAYAAFALDASSYVWAWGDGAVGDNVGVSRSSPVSVVGNRQFVKFSKGQGGVIFAIDSSSYAWAWGQGTNGTLGDGTVTTKVSPVSVMGGYRFTDIFSSYNSYVAAGISGSDILYWGRINQYGNPFNAFMLSVNVSAPVAITSKSPHNYIASPYISRKNIFGIY